VHATEMAKSKNHTNHNQNFKAHRNGIKRPRLGTKISTKGVSSPTPAPPRVHLSKENSCYAAGGSGWIRCGQKVVAAAHTKKRSGVKDRRGRGSRGCICNAVMYTRKTHTHTCVHIVV
jgi:large subunit ribosomal protein L29e